MGMYTEFYFRANIKDGPVADWLEQQINTDAWFTDTPPYDPPFDHPFFSTSRWTMMFIGGGAVYQTSREPKFTRKDQKYVHDNTLIVSSSLKNYGDEIKLFIDWISPHLDMWDGDFLGYSLYEDTRGDGIPGCHRDHPVLYFYNQEPVQA